MIEIGMNKIVKNFGYKKILDGVSLEIMTGDRAAIVGRNGTGKTTLLKLIAGKEPPDSGEISIRRGASIGYLEQIPPLRRPGVTVKEVLLEPFSRAPSARERREACWQSTFSPGKMCSSAFPPCPAAKRCS